jgi:hypothetical protein
MSSLLSVAFGTCDAVGHVSPPEPSSARQREPSIVGHAAALEPPQEEGPCSGLLDMWRYGALPSGEAAP